MHRIIAFADRMSVRKINYFLFACYTDPSKHLHYVVDCGKPVMKEHCYWPLVSDLNNVLSHRPVALKFMADESLLEMWFAFLSYFQGKFYTYTFCTNNFFRSVKIFYCTLIIIFIGERSKVFVVTIIFKG